VNLQLESHAAQARRWPAAGRHVLAQFDRESVLVYQAYRPQIGLFAAAHGYFEDGFSLHRMSWIKPNFLWMMHRSGWAGKEGQEVVLGVRLRRDAFDGILAAAVPSSFDRRRYASAAAWSRAVAESDVRLQWDPDHDPHGAAIKRRALQLGLRGRPLARYAREWILSIEDVSDFARAQHALVVGGRALEMKTPREEVYPVADPAVAERLGIGLDS